MGIRGGPLPGPQTRLGPLGRPSPALLPPRPGTSSVRQEPCFLLFTEQKQVAVAMHRPCLGNPLVCWGLWEVGEEKWYGVGLSSWGGEVTVVQFQGRLFCCVMLAKLHSLHSVNDCSALGMAHLSHERPQLPHLQTGNRDFSCLSGWQPQGWMLTASFQSC